MNYLCILILFIYIFFTFLSCKKNNILNYNDVYKYAVELYDESIYDEIIFENEYSSNKEEDEIDLSDYETIDKDNASSWVNIYKKTWNDLDFKFKEAIVFSIIPDEYKNEYISYLNNSSYIKLDNDEYLKLTQKKLTKKYGIAVRAVHAQLGGIFIIIKNNKNEYSINYYAMGSRVWQIDKTVLIFEANKLPKNIYIEYSVIK